MKAIALGIFTGGMLRIIFGMHPLNSPSMNTPRILLGIMACVVVMLIVRGIAELWRASGNKEDIFD